MNSYYQAIVRGCFELLSIRSRGGEISTPFPHDRVPFSDVIRRGHLQIDRALLLAVSRHFSDTTGITLANSSDYNLGYRRNTAILL